MRKTIVAKSVRNQKHAMTSATHAVPEYLKNVTKEKIKGLVSELEESQKASYLCKLLESNEFQPYGLEEVHNNLEAKENACDLNDSCLRDNVLGNLGKLDPGSANLAILSIDNIDIVKESLSKNHSQLLEVEKNTRRQASCEQWYAERKIRLTASNFGVVVKRKTCYPKSILKKIIRLQGR
jgi:hypothetical protein